MAIVLNADWFMSRQSREGYIDVEGDEFYGLRGDATLVGHSVTVRCYAGILTASDYYFDSARASEGETNGACKADQFSGSY